jgi:serine protease Do
MRMLALLVLALAVASPAGAQSTPTFGELYRKTSPSVVTVRARGTQVTATSTITFSEIGSGVLISKDGRIATASHVVHGMENITVEFLGQEPIRARILGFQPGADLALLQIESVPPDAPVAALGDSDRVDIGDSVFIIGAPYGLTYSLSTGIVSARWKPDTISRDFPLAEFFQTDATINTGNSGGPMFNQTGQVIGIVSHLITKSGGSEGLGFVVTSATVRRLLIDRRLFYLGVEGEVLSESLARLLNVAQGGGYLVKTVVTGSLGHRLGLRGGDHMATIAGQSVIVGGDIILTSQGVKLLTLEDLIQANRLIRDQPPGREVRMRVLREGAVVELTTTWTAADSAATR